MAEKKRKPRTEQYLDEAGKWRWRVVAGNGRIISTSSQGYVNRGDCTDSIRITGEAFLLPVVQVNTDEQQPGWFSRLVRSL